MVYHDKPVKEVFEIKASSEEGLSSVEARNRLKRFGLNRIEEGKKVHPFVIFLRQFQNVLVYILIAAVILSFLLGENADAYVILVILVFNALFGFFQEYKAERAIELLRKLTTLNAKVLRDGRVVQVPSSEIVPGDVVILEAGDRVPADVRLFEVNSLRTDESPLTGESTPCSKRVDALSEKTPLAERVNMAFTGTSVVRGDGKGVVVETGMSTEFGKIARMVQEVEEHETPLQVKLKGLGKFLGYATLGICFAIFLIGIYRNVDVFVMLLTAISLAVAAVPEGLPAVVTICLALGVQRMIKRNALIKRLRSIETLGSITVICSDKTGTLTKNEMTVTRIFANNKVYEVSGRGYTDQGSFTCENKPVNARELKVALEISISCNNASESVGDPTERALFFVARKGGVKALRRYDEIPFDSDKKFMATKHSDQIWYYKGAPEVILEKCRYVFVDERARRLTERDREKMLKVNHEFAESALRVLAVAYQKGSDYYFVGLMGMIDPPKEGVRYAIKTCLTAGIRPVMITGDHPLTAKAIGEKVDLVGGVLTGSELDEISDEDLRAKVMNYVIFARATSEHKVRILHALQARGHIVAMTGDGINDAPALKSADVGVAMSVKGTDVSRDAADMVLTDDHFASIVNAVEEGRVIYENIKKFVNYLLSANAAELGVILGAIVLNLPLPLIPIQILWINLMTDSWPALALSVDKPEENVMKRQPKDPSERIMKGLKGFMFITGVLGTMLVLGVFYDYYASGRSLDEARTMAMTTLIVFELMRVYGCKSKKPFKNFFTNKWLNYAVLVSLFLQVAIMYVPLLNGVFHLVPLSVVQWGVIVVLSGVAFVGLEWSKKVIVRGEA